MTRKQLEGICRFVLTFESDMSIEEVNKQFGLELSDADSHVKALTSYLEKNKIQLDDNKPEDRDNVLKNSEHMWCFKYADGNLLGDRLSYSKELLIKWVMENFKDSWPNINSYGHTIVKVELKEIN